MQSSDDEIIPSDLLLNQSEQAASSLAVATKATVKKLSINRRVTAGFYTNSPSALAALPPRAAESIREFKSTPIPPRSLLEASKVNLDELSVREDIAAQVMLDVSKKDQEDPSKDDKAAAVIKNKNYYSAGVMVLVPEASSPDLKKANNQLWNEPSNNLAYFQREALEAEIVKHLFSQATEKTKSNTPASRKMLTLYGLSGTGKTVLAINTIYQSGDYVTRCWFDAKNISTLKDQFANFAKEMKIVSAETPVELAYKKAKDWLKQNPRSLLIFDNAEDYKTLSEFLPNVGVDILITSLNNNWPGTVIEVPVFNLFTGEEYVKFLLEGDDKNIATLVNKFGGHPLALAQASAYIKGKETVASYLKHYEIIKAKLLEDQSLPPDSEHEPIAISWYRIMQAIKAESEEALEVLSVCAFLHGDNIPEKLIKAWLRDKLSYDEKYELSKEKVKANLWEKMHGFKKIYAKYSILTIHSAKKCFAMHKLLQAVVKQQMDKQSKEELLKNLLKVIYFKFSVSTRNKRFFQQRQLYIPHLESLIEYCQQAKLENIDYYLTCLNSLGVAYVRPEDRYKKKEVLLKSLALIKSSKTAKELDTAKILINLSFACQQLQGYEQAGSFLNEAISLAAVIKQKSKKSFTSYDKESDQVMLACYINLGLIHIDLNNRHKAIEFLKCALKRCLKLSNSFREKAIYIQGLGMITNQAVRPRGSFLIYTDVCLEQNALDKYSSKSLGGRNDESYDFSELLLIITLTHLGNVYYKKGLKDNDSSSFLQSKAYLDKALQYHSVEGNKMHPARAIAFMYLGKVHQQLRLFAEAEANYINSLRITKYVFDDAHLNMAECFNNLYELYKQVGYYSLAMECLNIVLRISSNYFTNDSEEIVKILNEKEVCQAILLNYHPEDSQDEKNVDSIISHVKNLNKLDYYDENQAPVILSPAVNIDEKLLQDLIKNLSDDDADIRQSAAQTLIKLGRINASVLEALIKNIGNEDWSMRKNVTKILEELRALNDPKVLKSYIKNLSSDNSYVRKEALKVLKKDGNGPILIDALINNLSSNNCDVRAEASFKLTMLGWSNSSEVINAYIKNFNSPDAELRQESAEVLIKLETTKQEVKEIQIRNLDNFDISDVMKAFMDNSSVFKVKHKPISLATSIEIEQAKQKALDTCIKNLDVDDSSIRIRAARVLIIFEMETEKVINALIRNLSDEDNLSGSIDLLEKLGKASDLRVIDAHLNNLNSDNSSIVRMSTEALYKAGKTGQKIVDACKKNLSDKKHYTVERAAETLLKLGKIDNNAIEILFNRLTDENHWVSGAAKEQLIKWGKDNPPVVDFLINKLSVCASKVKGLIAEILGAIGNAEEKVVTALLASLKDEDAGTRQSVAAALIDLNAENDQVVETFIQNANDPSIFIRMCALQKIGNLGKPCDRVIEALMSGLGDEDSDVRKSAENSLQRLKKMDDLKVHAASLLNLKSKNYKIKQFGIEMIGRHKIINDQLFAELIKCLSDDFKSIRRSALETLEKLGKSADPKVVVAHIGNLIHPVEEIKLSSIEALGNLEKAGDDVINALNKCSSNEKDTVSKAAAEVIKKLTNRATTELTKVNDQRRFIIDSAKKDDPSPTKKDGVKKDLAESTDTVVSSPEISRSASRSISPSHSLSQSPSSSRSPSPVDSNAELNKLKDKLGEFKKELDENSEVERIELKKTDDKNAKNRQSRHAIFNDKKALGTLSKILPPLPSQEEIQRNYLISLTKQNKDSASTDEDHDLPDAVEMHDPSLHDSDNDSGDNKSQQPQRP